MSGAPILIVVCGVSGSGKTSVARELARLTDLPFLDADDFHSEQARQMMTRAVPLNDELRTPWIESICVHLRQMSKAGHSCVLAFSGLKQSYREPLRHTGHRVIFLMLEGSEALIRSRLQQRQAHFMPGSLLESQFRTLETPIDEPDVVTLDVSPPLEAVVQAALEHLERRQILQNR